MEGNEEPNQQSIRIFGEKEKGEYLEADTTKQVEIKRKKDYPRQKLLETKLSSRNLIKGINNRPEPLVRYSVPKWTTEKLR